MRFGGQELLIILVIVLVLFGASRLPALARSIGQSAKEFRKGIEEGATEAAEASTDDPAD
jgi:sec-independent protein translocase protein TatA